MKWKKFRITTTEEAEDIIISALYDIGLEGAQIEDKKPMTALEKEQMFVDIAPDVGEDDGIAYLSFFVEENDNGELFINEEKISEEKILGMVKAELDAISEYCDIGLGEIAVDETEDIDWINNWKKYFHQFTVDDLLVIPSWEDVKPEDADKKILHIDPGTAFGTGMHETTQLCLKALKKNLNEDTRLLDVGTGSGILSIVAIMYGAKDAVALDLDPCAVFAVEDNMASNNIPKEKLELIIGNIIDDKEIQEKVGCEAYDICVANILAEVLIPLTPVVKNHIKKDGLFIVSGILNGKEEAVASVMRDNGMEILEINYQGEWAGITAKKL